MKKALFLASALFLSTTASFAQQTNFVCANHDDLERVLLEKYKEVVVAQAITAAPNLIEIYASAEGTFSVVITEATGVSCILADGTNFVMVEPVFPPNL